MRELRENREAVKTARVHRFASLSQLTHACGENSRKTPGTRVPIGLCQQASEKIGHLSP